MWDWMHRLEARSGLGCTSSSLETISGKTGLQTGPFAVRAMVERAVQGSKDITLVVESTHLQAALPKK